MIFAVFAAQPSIIEFTMMGCKQIGKTLLRNWK